MSIFIIAADCGGGDDYNPYSTLEKALERIEAVDGDATGLEVWQLPDSATQEDRDNPAYCSRARVVWERW